MLGNAHTGASASAGVLGTSTRIVRVTPSTSTHTMPCICGCSFAHHRCDFPSGKLIVNSPFHPFREFRSFGSCRFSVSIAESDIFLLFQDTSRGIRPRERVSSHPPHDFRIFGSAPSRYPFVESDGTSSRHRVMPD